MKTSALVQLPSCTQPLQCKVCSSLSRSSEFCLMWDNFLLPGDLLLARYQESSIWLASSPFHVSNGCQTPLVDDSIIGLYMIVLTKSNQDIGKCHNLLDPLGESGNSLSTNQHQGTAFLVLSTARHNNSTFEAVFCQAACTMGG